MYQARDDKRQTNSGKQAVTIAETNGKNHNNTKIKKKKH